MESVLASGERERVFGQRGRMWERKCRVRDERERVMMEWEDYSGFRWGVEDFSNENFQYLCV